MRRKDRRLHVKSELMLAAMVDMMVNILVFLLMLYGTDPVGVEGGEDLVLPDSSADEALKYALLVQVTREGVAFDGVTVAPLVERDGVLVLDPALLDRGTLVPLAQAMAPKVADARSAATEEAPFAGEVVILVDKRVPWSVVAPVARTADRVGLPKFRFLVNQQAASPG